MPLNHELDKLGISTLPYFIYGLHLKSRWRRLQASAGVFRACLEFRPDVIYLNQSGCYKVTLPAATVFNLPIVAHVRIFEDASYLAKQRPSSRRLRGVVAISSSVESEIRRYQELDRITLDRIYDAYVPAARLVHHSARLKNRLACVGRIVPIKGQDVLVHALCGLRDFNQSIECLFVGGGEQSYIEKIRAIIARENLEDTIQWLGFVEDVIPLLRTCSVLVCPSHMEPLGRVIFEAWDAGVVPVAFSRSGGAAEIIAAAEGGILYDEQTPQALSRALRTAFELEEDQRTRLINNGRSWMAANCEPSTYAKALSGIFARAQVVSHKSSWSRIRRRWHHC
jgi:glycosyltransferase involved in cell wall biosynthesis